MKFSKELMLNILNGNAAEEIVYDRVVDNTSWSIIYELVFKYNNKYYKTSYSVGATEYQDETPWEYNDEIECEEVEPIQKLITVYEKVKI